MSKNTSHTKTGPGRIATTGKTVSKYLPKVVPGYCITYSEQDRLVRENSYKTTVVKELMKDSRAFLNSYRQAPKQESVEAPVEA